MNLTFKLINENQKNTIILIVIIYELNKKKLFAKKKLNEKSTANENFEKNSFNEKLNKKSLNENFIF